MFLGLVHAAVLGAALRVEGDVSCPAPTEVAADVQKILGLSEEYAPKVHATLAREGAFIRLRLTELDGTSLGERLLTANDDCVVLSRAAAVVLAAWLTDQHPEFLVALPTAATDGTPNSAAGETNSAAPSATPAPPTAPVKPAAVPPPASAAAPSASTPPTHRLALGAAIGGGWASSQFVPGVWLGVSLDPVQTGWGAQLSAAWLGEHTQDLHDNGGYVSWSRWPLMLGPYVRFGTKFGTLELEGGPALGWLHLKGQNFAQNFGAESKAQVGGYGALRFMPKTDAWHPFVMLAPVLWFNRETAQSVPAGDPNGDATAFTRLSSFELLFTLGIRILP